MENLLLTPGMLGIDSPTVGWLIQLAVAGILLALLLVAADAESVPSARTACLGREIVGHETRCRAVGHVTAFSATLRLLPYWIDFGLQQSSELC